MTNPSEKAELSNSNNYDLPLRNEIPALSRQIIKLIIDNNDDDLPLRSKILTPFK